MVFPQPCKGKTICLPALPGGEGGDIANLPGNYDIDEQPQFRPACASAD